MYIYIYIYIHTYIYRERDNVVYWKETKGKDNNDL